jgi:hypothetical protein
VVANEKSTSAKVTEASHDGLHLQGAYGDRHKPIAVFGTGISPDIEMGSDDADLMITEAIASTHLADVLTFGPKLDAL